MTCDARGMYTCDPGRLAPNRVMICIRAMLVLGGYAETVQNYNSLLFEFQNEGDIWKT